MMGNHKYWIGAFSLFILISITAACQKTPTPSTDVSVSASTTEQLFDMKSPTLLGFSLGEIRSNIDSTLGPPKGQYTLEDGNEVIFVDEFEGFYIGYDESDRLKFIDIYSPDVNPGIHGLRIGDSASDAVALLGEPSHRTHSVLAYRGDREVLRIDIDSSNEAILSFKLFTSVP